MPPVAPDSSHTPQASAVQVLSWEDVRRSEVKAVDTCTLVFWLPGGLAVDVGAL